MELLIATHNQGKVGELNSLLANFGVRCLSLAEVGITEDVEETGETFVDNAVLKANYYAAASNLLTLADDSGLEVAALNGQPGVHSKRYGGDAVPIYTRLMRELADVPWAERGARFRCVMALADGTGLLGTAEGVCEGWIALAPQGDGGFGYDPVFYLPEQELTMAQLPRAEKDKVSHRGRAIAAITPLLKKQLGVA